MSAPATPDTPLAIPGPSAKMQAAGAPVDLLLMGPDTPEPAALPAGIRRVTAPGGRGLLLMRVLVGDYAAERVAVEAARRTLRCTPLA